jgi:tRNA threonylcarbamoyl adenosine modification protein YeaZ
MIEELLESRVADRIIVGIGPGSFTGIRVGIAAAQGLAIGWDAKLAGMSSLALIAAGAASEGPVAAAMHGGHGELLVQQFDQTLTALTPLFNLPPNEAAVMVSAEMVVGPAANDLVAARGSGQAIESWPSAANALKLPDELRSLPARPVYARAPDAKARPSILIGTDSKAA